MGGIRVRKYGGTSVADTGRIAAVAARLVEAGRRGCAQVVVVSAMGSLTDELRRMAGELTETPNRRELDMLLASGEQISIALLAMAVNSLGGRAVSLTAGQCGIVTDMRFSRARIQDIRTDRVRRELDQGRIVVVAGFQGVTPGQDITTLGRGGSDITAVALAAALDSAECEIYTDVAGVHSADPRLVPDARVLERVGYREMLEYAASGSKVLHPRAVEIARVFAVPVRVLSSLEPGSGTLICSGQPMEKTAITGVTADRDVARVTLTGVFDRPGIAAAVSRALAEADIQVRLFIQSMAHGEANDVCVIIDEADVATAEERLAAIADAVGADAVVIEPRVGKVSIVGSGIAGSPWVAARMFEALADSGINIELISSSEVRIACIVAESQLDAAVRALHDAFDLGEAGAADGKDGSRSG